jgi:hypothetical protein
MTFQPQCETEKILKMKNLILFLIILFSLYSFSCSEKRNKIVIFPGVGISLNNDSILLDKTSSEALSLILKQKDTFNISKKHTELFDPKNGEESSIDEIIKHIYYKDIDFEYRGETKDNLLLQYITIKENPDYSVFIHDNISLGQINPPIDQFYELKSESYDFQSDDNLVYHFYSQGISFRLDSVLNGRQLIEVTVHFTFVKEK